MAKKKINIILIFVVLGLWGSVVYKTFNRQFVSNNVTPEKQDPQIIVSIDQINKDTFELKKINRDPFLNKEMQTITAVPRKIRSNYKLTRKVFAPIKQKADPNLKWPTLAYYGYIKSKDQELVLLKVGTKLRKFKLNDPINGLVIKKKYKDSIEVLFNSETRIIHINL